MLVAETNPAVVERVLSIEQLPQIHHFICISLERVRTSHAELDRPNH